MTEQDTQHLAHLRGGFAREFATADGERVMVAALTPQQFADLASTTRLARTFAFVERALRADFSATTHDLHAHRDTIAALLAPWFARRTGADLSAAFAGTAALAAHTASPPVSAAGKPGRHPGPPPLPEPGIRTRGRARVWPWCARGRRTRP